MIELHKNNNTSLINIRLRFGWFGELIEFALPNLSLICNGISEIIKTNAYY